MKSRDLYLNKIIPFLQKPVVKVIAGMRRSGKSTFLTLIQSYLEAEGYPSDSFITVNMESLEFEHIVHYQAFYKYIKEKIAECSGPPTVLIDEIQEIESWEKAIASLLAENNYDLIITGSNAHLLSSELATLLTGRYVEIKIYPLTFKEYVFFRDKESATLQEQKALFNDYLKYGGFPGLHFLGNEESIVSIYLNSLFQSILLKDVVARYTIRDTHLLEYITRFVFDNCGNITNAKRIADYFKSQRIKCSVDTVIKYIQYLQETFLIFKVQRYDIKGLRLLEVNDKYYMGDIGLRHSFLGYKDRDISGLLENVVYLDLLSRGWTLNIGKVDDFEVDFVAEKNGNRNYFQVAYLMPDMKTRDREFRSLELIPDNYEKIVLSLDSVLEDRKGIKSMDLIEWLLR